MKRIGLTQRVEIVPRSGANEPERRDCLDQNWEPLLQSLGLTAVPLGNRIEDAAGHVERLGLDGVILTGGNDLAHLQDARSVAPERDALEKSLIEACLKAGLPILGVCRGMQMLNHTFGGTVMRGEGHVNTRHSVRVSGSFLDFYPPVMEVNSYHGYTIPKATLSPRLNPVGETEDGGIEAFRHPDKPCAGIMWHPERESPAASGDAALIKNLFGAT